MAVNASRITTITYTGDVIGTETLPAAANAISPGSVTYHSLTTGANTITLPSGASISVKGATIVPPLSNAQTITLKGISGDTGIALSKTDPTSISFDTSPPTSFVLTVGGNIDALRIFWT